MKTLTRVVELTPEAFNMRSSRVVLAFGEKQEALWGGIYEAFGVPEAWVLVAQMPFGGIAAPAGEKSGERISDRMRVAH